MFLEASRGLQSTSQLEESIKKNLFGNVETESREIKQFKQFLTVIAKELEKQQKSPKSLLYKFAAKLGERYDRITGTNLGSRFLSVKPKLRKFVAPNQQPVELNEQEKKLLKQIANMFSGAGQDVDQELNEFGIAKTFAKL
jgi:hypothetical protein